MNINLKLKKVKFMVRLLQIHQVFNSRLLMFIKDK